MFVGGYKLVKLVWRVLLFFFLSLLLLGIGFSLGFFSGETIYNYVIEPPFRNTRGDFDNSILWTAIAGLGTMLLGIITIILNISINKQNKKHQQEIEEKNRKHTDDLFKKQQKIDKAKERLEFESWQIMAKAELDYHYNILTGFRDVVLPVHGNTEINTINAIMNFEIGININPEITNNYKIARKAFDSSYSDFYKYCTDFAFFQLQHIQIKRMYVNGNQSEYERRVFLSYPKTFIGYVNDLISAIEKLKTNFE